VKTKLKNKKAVFKLINLKEYKGVIGNRRKKQKKQKLL